MDFDSAVINASAIYKERINKISEEIEKEKSLPNPDKYKILKMEESKLMADLFSDPLYGPMAKFRSPW